MKLDGLIENLNKILLLYHITKQYCYDKKVKATEEVMFFRGFYIFEYLN